MLFMLFIAHSVCSALALLLPLVHRRFVRRPGSPELISCRIDCLLWSVSAVRGAVRYVCQI